MYGNLSKTLIKVPFYLNNTMSQSTSKLGNYTKSPTFFMGRFDPIKRYNLRINKRLFRYNDYMDKNNTALLDINFNNNPRYLAPIRGTFPDKNFNQFISFIYDKAGYDNNIFRKNNSQIELAIPSNGIMISDNFKADNEKYYNDPNGNTEDLNEKLSKDKDNICSEGKENIDVIFNKKISSKPMIKCNHINKFPVFGTNKEYTSSCLPKLNSGYIVSDNNNENNQKILYKKNIGRKIGALSDINRDKVFSSQKGLTKDFPLQRISNPNNRYTKIPVAI